MITPRSRRFRDEDGISLVELIVVTLILGIVSGVIVSATISSLQASRRAQDRVIALNELTISLERVSREIRAAYELDPTVLTDIGDANSVIAANVQRDGEVFRHRFYLDETVTPTVLRSDLYRDDAGTDVLIHTAELVIDTANTEVGEKLVRYYAADGLELECAPPDTLVECTDRLSGAQFVELRLVRALPEQSPLIVQTLVNIRSSRF